MKTNHSPLLILLLLLAAIAAACNLGGLLQPTETVPAIPAEATESVATPTEAAEEPTEVSLPTGAPAETPPPPNNGQIAFTSGGNLWLYAVDSGSLTQLTTDGIAGSYENEYQNPQLSADGLLLAYMKNNISYIHSLADGSVTNLIHHGRFFRWTDNPREFFATRGNFECPALDNLEDQELIAFDVMRFSLDNLDTPLVLGNIAGGLRFPQAISNDGRWGSFLNCACYSECGGYSVWEIASGTTREHGLETLFTGAVDFSPNSAQLTVASQQMYGFIESPLYLANADFSGLHEIYFTPGEAPMDPRWSPDGGWIAFTVYVIDSTTYEASNSRVMLIRPDGSGLTTVEGGYAVFLDWSPDGSQLLYSMPAEGGTALYLYDLATAEKTLLPISTSPQLDWGVLP